MSDRTDLSSAGRLGSEQTQFRLLACSGGIHTTGRARTNSVQMDQGDLHSALTSTSSLLRCEGCGRDDSEFRWRFEVRTKD